MNTAERVRKVVAEVLGIDPGRLRDDSGMNREASWDSVRHVAIVARLESDFDLEFSDDEVVTAVDLAPLIVLVETKRSAPAG